MERLLSAAIGKIIPASMNKDRKLASFDDYEELMKQVSTLAGGKKIDERNDDSEDSDDEDEASLGWDDLSVSSINHNYRTTPLTNYSPFEQTWKSKTTITPLP